MKEAMVVKIGKKHINSKRIVKNSQLSDISQVQGEFNNILFISSRPKSNF